MTVQHYSPFRYPGGKSWFVPTFNKYVSKCDVLIEPFAGGATVGLTGVVRIKDKRDEYKPTR